MNDKSKGEFMEVVKIIHVPANYLFDVFLHSIQADIKNQTGQEVSREAVTGFEYTKEFSANNRATVRIESFIRNELYQYSTHTDKNTIVVKYEVVPLSDDSCELRYTETITSNGFLQKMNDTFVGFIWGFLKKRKFKEMFNQIEQSYTEN